MSELLTIKEASKWATKYLNKEVTTSNISYLIQYGRIEKRSKNGQTFISKEELKNYYQSFLGKRETDWKKQLGNDLNWHLSFDYLKESDTTKHVHRLHPYKGKFIPQLVEYFLNNKKDEFKTDVYFKEGDIVLDPFSGSGTTMVQASEMGMHSIGVDVSAFNALIGNVKIGRYDFVDIQREIKHISLKLREFVGQKKHLEFDQKLLAILTNFNKQYFPSPEFKIWVRKKEIDEKTYTKQKLDEILPVYRNLVKEFEIPLYQEATGHEFLDKWYLPPIRDELELIFEHIKKVQRVSTKKALSVILSRTIRSCRATTHADLATLIDPVREIYYCRKHGKVCKPLFTLLNWWERYCKDTLKRFSIFNNLRTNTHQICLVGDSQNIDIFSAIEKTNPVFAELAKQQKIKGIFSSPPYVGLINYHEQHAYAYDLFGFKRRDELEIGPLFKGKGREARASYIEGISQVLKNSKRFMVEDFDVFLVSNDKFNMYPSIAEKAKMKIVNQFKRPVLNRTEKDKRAYSEIIFHLKANQ